MTPVASTVERVEQRVIHLERAQSRRCSRKPCGGNRSAARWSSSAPSTAPTRSRAALVKSGIAAEAMHGNKSQNQRERVLAAFRDGRLRTLIATDIAARGIDVEGISHVINYDLPNVPETYVHRIGRTARAGAAGVAISFCSADEAPTPARNREADPDGSIPKTGGRSSAAPRPRSERVLANRRISGGARPARAPRPAGVPPKELARKALAAVAFLRRAPDARWRMHSASYAGYKSRERRHMAKEELLEFEGMVTEVLPERKFPGPPRQRTRNSGLYGRQNAQIPHPNRRRRPRHRRDVALRPRPRQDQLPA